MGSITPLRRKTASRPSSTASGVDRQYASRSELVYAELREAIEQGKLKPGERVMEVEIAEWLNVSRTPVRDALRRLEMEGVLALEPRNGLVVSSLDRQAMVELYVMREVLEGTAARLCAEHASDFERMELTDLVKREEKLRGNFEALVRHNRLIHEAVHRGAHNRYLEKSLAAVNDSMWLLGKSQMLLPHRAKTAESEHRELAAAILKRDPAAAEEAARRHVRSAQHERMKQLFPGKRN
jgi:DNA-binding GntR family transcriptional regulator